PASQEEKENSRAAYVAVVAGRPLGRSCGPTASRKKIHPTTKPFFSASPSLSRYAPDGLLWNCKGCTRWRWGRWALTTKLYFARNLVYLPKYIPWTRRGKVGTSLYCFNIVPA